MWIYKYFQYLRTKRQVGFLRQKIEIFSTLNLLKNMLPGYSSVYIKVMQ